MPITRIDGAACADATAAVDASRAAATESAAAVAYAHLDTPAIVRRKLAASRHRLDEVMRHLIVTASRYGIDPAVAEEFAVAATSTLHGKGWIRIDRSIAEERDDLTAALRHVIEQQGVEFAGFIPADELIFEYDLNGRPLVQLPADSKALTSYYPVLDKLVP